MHIYISGPTWIYMMIFILAVSFIVVGYITFKKILPSKRSGEKVLGRNLATVGVAALIAALSIVAMW
jgi:uncharacterized membrane protein